MDEVAAAHFQEARRVSGKGPAAATPASRLPHQLEYSELPWPWQEPTGPSQPTVVCASFLTSTLIPLAPRSQHLQVLSVSFLSKKKNHKTSELGDAVLLCKREKCCTQAVIIYLC
jgi:hypothetical protein